MELEAAISPRRVFVDSQIRDYAFSIHKLSQSHPVHKVILRKRANPYQCKQSPRQFTQLQRIAYSIEKRLQGDLEQI